MQAVLMGVTAEVSRFCLLLLAGPPFQCKVLAVPRWLVGIKEVEVVVPLKAPSVISLPVSSVPPQLYNTGEFSL